MKQQAHERMCIVCRVRSDKRLLKRVVRNSDGEIFMDVSGKRDGRGAYVCSIRCMAQCKKAKLLNKAFKCAVPDEVYNNLLREFEGT
ncbi:MAG: YlxR family protein [Firmicutes bacterium]|nr:YlxR family protein [Bacillota bacterium]